MKPYFVNEKIKQGVKFAESITKQIIWGKSKNFLTDFEKRQEIINEARRITINND